MRLCVTCPSSLGQERHVAAPLAGHRKIAFADAGGDDRQKTASPIAFGGLSMGKISCA